MSDTLTEKDLSKRWKLTDRTLQMWRSKGIGPRYIRIGERSIFYRISDVVDYEKSKTVGNRTAPYGWEESVKRAAGAINMLASKAKTKNAKETLCNIRDELRSLLSDTQQ